MKSVTLPLDVFGKFRSADNEMAGEVFKYILNYVVDGEQKHFTDTYKEMLFESLLEPIRPQMARYSERAEQCQEMARERKKSSKTSRKKNGKVVRNDDKVESANDDVAKGNVDDTATNDNESLCIVNVADSNEVVNDSNDNVTSSCDNVASTDEDVSFATFMSIYGHRDKGGFDTEAVWNRLDEDDKREAIRYARWYVQQVPDAQNREWPSKFISTRPWTQGSNQ